MCPWLHNDTSFFKGFPFALDMGWFPLVIVSFVVVWVSVKALFKVAQYRFVCSWVRGSNYKSYFILNVDGSGRVD